MDEKLNSNTLSNSDKLEISPLPANNNCFISFFSKDALIGNYQIFDLAGNLISSAQIEIISNENKLSIDTENLLSGYYIIQVQLGDKKLRETLIVQHD